MDVPGLGQERYSNFSDLYVYCYRVAGTVGLMTLPILGHLPLLIDFPSSRFQGQHQDTPKTRRRNQRWLSASLCS